MILLATTGQLHEILGRAYDFSFNYHTIAWIFRHILWFYLRVPDNCMNFQGETMILLVTTTRSYEISGRAYALVWNYHTIRRIFKNWLWFYLQLPHRYKNFQVSTMILHATTLRLYEISGRAYALAWNYHTNTRVFSCSLWFYLQLPPDCMKS
jgi:hypothetical protein